MYRQLENPNPFYFGRIEQEAEPILYIPDSIVEWASSTPILFEGLRGSGKSSVLKMLSWDVRWIFSTQRIKGSPIINKFFNDINHIGVYFRVEDVGVQLWRRWKVKMSLAQDYFATFLEFLYLSLFFDALDRIQKIDPELFSETSKEKLLVQTVLADCFPVISTRPQMLHFTYHSMWKTLSEIHRGIRHMVYQNLPESLIKESYSIVEPGSLIKSFGNNFIRAFPELSHWKLLILLDDCNFLTKWQTEVVNTAISNCYTPISYKLSSITGMYKTLATLDKNKPLIIDLIKTQSLPNQQKYTGINIKGKHGGVRYATMINNICKARIEYYYGPKIASKFNLKRILGTFDLDQLIESKLSASESEKAGELLLFAERNKKTTKTLPVIKTWLTEKQIRKFKEPSIENILQAKKRNRQISSIYYKKWHYVAGISLCKDYKFQFPYCGHDIALHLSAGSIREMLRILSMLWELCGQDISHFLEEEPIPHSIQTKSMNNAAEEKFDLIDSSVISDESSSLKLFCFRLGSLFSKCQSYPYILTTAETGSISLRNDSIDADLRNILEMGVVSGCLLRKENEHHTLIALHPILAPKFGIVHRNPFYYPEPINNITLIKSLAFGSNAEVNKSIKLILANRINRYFNRHNQGMSDISPIKLLF